MTLQDQFVHIMKNLSICILAQLIKHILGLKKTSRQGVLYIFLSLAPRITEGTIHKKDN